MSGPRVSGDGPRQEPHLVEASDPNPERDRTLKGVQELCALTILMYASKTLDEVLEVLENSVESLTGCTLVLVLFRRHGQWTTWPTPGVATVLADPRSMPSVVHDGDAWTCTAAVGPPTGRPGQLVLSGTTEPEPRQLFLIEELGRLLGASLTDVELHERDRQRTVELESANAELAAAAASLRHRRAVQDSFARLAATGREVDVAASLNRLTGRTVVVRDAFGHETTRVGREQPGRGPVEQVTVATSLPTSTEDSMPASPSGGGSAWSPTITLELTETDGSHDLDDDARFALHCASTALGVLAAHERAMGEMENRLSRDLTEDLLDAVARDTAVARAAAQGHDLRTPHDVIVIVWPGASSRTDRADHLVEGVRQALHRQGRHFLLTRRHGELVVLAHRGVDIEVLFDDLVAVLGRPAGLVAKGEPAVTTRRVPRAYRQARRALATRQSSSEPWGSIAYADLGVDRILTVEGNAGEVERLVSQWLDELITYDSAHGSELVPTLATYLDRGGKYDETAQVMSIHRNTLRYRLNRITEISGHDLADTETRFNLHLATRAWRLRAGPTLGKPGPTLS